MAEFKLGRLRFVWKNDWSAGATYYQDDIVAYAGKAYLCVSGHVAQDNFYADLNLNPTRWNIVAQGQTWKNEWQPQIFYDVNDIVKYGGRLYICITEHTSAEDSGTGLEVDYDKWQIFAEGLEWKGEWSPGFDYKINDLVKYGGTTYVCNTHHIAAATYDLGLEDDIDNWDLFNRGIDYKDTWSPNFRYKQNDVVRYGGSSFIATAPHLSATDFNLDTVNWQKFVDGFQFEDYWIYDKEYQTGDIVRYGGNQYIAIADSNGQNPVQQNSYWSLFSEGLRFRGNYGEDSAAVDYYVNDVVRLGGYTYRCLLDHQSQVPPNPTFWALFSPGIEWRGTWLDDQVYYVGDVVTLNDNSYICVKQHISEGDDFSTETPVDPGGGAQNSRPDLDTTATYWNIFVIGNQQAVLTTTGDLLYYSNAGPARLPIGTDGQILQVSTQGIPEWVSLSSTDDVYYVAEHGTDATAPEYGLTLDRPWRSIRYAATQVELGVKAPGAVRLLELNRRFIQREIIEWTDYQIVNATVGQLFYQFSYNSSKCERDMGYIIDAFIYDLRHGGNVKSREAALSYVNETTGSPYLGQKTETIASITYGISLIEKVLRQEAPDVNYQTLNGDNSSAIVLQYFEPSLGNQADKFYNSTVTGTYNGNSIG